MEAARKGFYVTKTGQKVVWRDAVQAACAAKRSIDPDATLPSNKRTTFNETRVQVTNETTLGASLRLVERGLRPLALNFANGIHPGGGFLSGARAQEEVLCRSSALYQTLIDDPMYEEHPKRQLPDSTDRAIYSPDVPVFRMDDGTELPHPWLLSFITCAAPKRRSSAWSATHKARGFGCRGERRSGSDVRDESASVCLGGAGRQCIEAVLPLATDEVRVDVRAPSRSAMFRYGQHVSAVERVFTRHNPLVSKSGRLSRVITTRSH